MRIDTGGATRLFIASNPLAASTNSPDTPAGVGDGWVEVVVPAPPPAPPFDAAVAYRNGDMAQSPQGSVWVATNPIAAGGAAPGTVGASADWVEVGRSTTVTVNNTVGETPVTNPPATPLEGDIFLNTSTDQASWVYDEDSTTWVPLAAGGMPTVTI